MLATTIIVLIVSSIILLGSITFLAYEFYAQKKEGNVVKNQTMLIPEHKINQVRFMNYCHQPKGVHRKFGNLQDLEPGQLENNLYQKENDGDSE